MPLKYTFEDKTDALCPLSRLYGAWYAAFLPAITYPDSKDFECGRAAFPGDVLDWLDGISDEDTTITPVKKQFLATLHDALKAAASEMLKGAPSEHDMEEFVRDYKQFAVQLQDTEEEEAFYHLGIDKATGLCSRAVIRTDLERELDRFERFGGEFCAAIARMDQFDEIGKLYGKDGQFKYMLITAEMIRESLRSFDEAYYIGNGEFVFCLKQADLTGGMAALERLRRILGERAHTVDIDGKDVLLSLSCCVTEPYPGDDVDKLMGHLHDDLENISKSEGGGVLEFLDESPLQRYKRTQSNAGDGAS